MVVIRVQITIFNFISFNHVLLKPLLTFCKQFLFNCSVNISFQRMCAAKFSFYPFTDFAYILHDRKHQHLVIFLVILVWIYSAWAFAATSNFPLNSI